MADAQADPPCKLHRPFRLYDPEAAAVLTILLGLFQVVLGFPTYFMIIDTPLLFICPVFVGVLHVIVGSFAMVCERSPSRQRMKSCFYCGVLGLLAGLSSIVVYSYANNKVPSDETCHTYVEDLCINQTTHLLIKGIFALLLVYDMGALIVLAFVSFSALKGLKSN